ncbi:MAG TPA: hypothetical protein VH141_24555 [Pseudonocardia sp.]|nr:hypothetical protein [Pseudonocardia sp.]
MRRGRVVSLRRWRALPLAGPSTPARLLRLGAVLVTGCLLTAGLSLFSGLSRQAATEQGNGRAAALTEDAAELYHSLADADAMATSGYVAGGDEPAAVRARYDDDLARAADRLVHAAGELAEDDPGHPLVATVAQQLPRYSGMIETARFYNRQGLPLGQSYLGSGSALVRDTVLPAVERLRRQQTAALAEDYQRGGAIPFAVLLVGAAALAGLLDAGRRERRRTNRVLNPGLATATGLVLLALLWWVGATVLTDVRLTQATRHGAAITALDNARAAVLQARSNENLVLVARGGGSASDAGYTGRLAAVLGPDGAGGLLGTAASSAGSAGTPAIDAARAAARDWQGAHRRLRELDDGGRYRDAVTSAIGTDPAGSRATFNRLDAALGQALREQRAALDSAAAAARSALTGLAAGPAVLALLAAAGVAAGIAIRVREYR